MGLRGFSLGPCAADGAAVGVAALCCRRVAPVGKPQPCWAWRVAKSSEKWRAEVGVVLSCITLGFRHSMRHGTLRPVTVPQMAPRYSW